MGIKNWPGWFIGALIGLIVWLADYRLFLVPEPNSFISNWLHDITVSLVGVPIVWGKFVALIYFLLIPAVIGHVIEWLIFRNQMSKIKRERG